MVNLSFSIDGIGDQFEYMRYPGKWDQAKQTMENSIKLKEQNKKYVFELVYYNKHNKYF